MMNCPPFGPHDVGTKLGTGDKTGDRGQNLGTGDKTGDRGQNLGTGDKTWGQTKKRLNLGSKDKTGTIHFGDLAIMQKNEFVISNDRQETYWGHPAE
jgi:hypothetical protein